MSQKGRMESLREFVTGRVDALAPLAFKIGLVNKRRRESMSKGATTTSFQWTDERAHPANMEKYENLIKDPMVSSALTSLTDMKVGVGFYTKMGDKEPADHDNKGAVDAYCERVNLDELLWKAEFQALAKGIAPLLKTSEGELKLLPAETFYRSQRPTGEDYRFTQKINGIEVSKWEGSDLNRFILLVNNESSRNPYGVSIVDGMEDRIQQRQDMAEDVPEIIHKHGYPFRVWQSATGAIHDVVFKQATERNIDEDIFLGNIPKDGLTIHTETLDPRVNFTQYVVHNDEQLAEGLHAPLMIYLRNATEASARTILESIQRSITARQRYLARRVERDIFKPLVGDPVPRIVWGNPKTGLENITLTEIGGLSRDYIITPVQAQDLIRKLGVPLAEAEPVDQQPDATLPKVPASMEATLRTIERTYREKRLTLPEALQEGDRAIVAYVEKQKMKAVKGLCESTGAKVEKLSPANERIFSVLRNELFDSFKTRLVPGLEGGGPPERSIRVVLQ